ncbi:NUDIX hydrolase [Saliniramus sp.]|uniref:NUDIX hydrolase n=1 Tax=Saliniramus sp. TaxID=2986772 RepID=UPI002C85FC55|nr:NUDIX hydrolase [Saliniramus sp.]HMB12114.1 NUDIX hydrolase [Saliniramus sp.]
MTESRGDFGYSIARIAAIHARLVPARWPWAKRNASMIAREWHAARARNPHLFDGEVLLAHRVSATAGCDGMLAIDFMPVRYSAFRAFKAAGFPDGFAVNVFPAIAPRDRAGRYLVGRMGAHTDNAGALYFATGTPDPGDVADDGRIDLTAAALRELAEETGLAPDRSVLEPYWHMLRRGGHLALIRVGRFDLLPAADLARHGEAARQSMAEPELAGIEVIGEEDDLMSAALPDFMRAYLARAFTGTLP